MLAAPIDFELERKAIAFVERRKSGTFDGRNVNECVGLAVIALDEAEAFHRIEELDGALGLFAGQLALRPPLGPLDSHRLAFDPKVGGRNTPAAIHQSELQRLSVGKVGQTRLLNGGNVDEHVLAAVIADNEAKSLLGIEELHHAFPFADDLGGHPASAASAAAETSASAAAEAAAIAAAESATVTESAIAAAEAAAFLESAAIAVTLFEEPVALVSTATAAVAFTPSVETHAR
jgi:hypothetical protein